MSMKTDRENRLDGEVESWIRAARSGSSESLGSLLQTFRQYLAIIAEHGLQGDMRAKVSRSDVVQETFLDAQRDFGNFHGDSREQLEAWLRRILLNNLMNQRRRYRETQSRATRRESPLNVHELSRDRQLASQDTSPSQRAVRNEESVALERALESLPQDYREVILLRNYQRLSFVDIGRRLDRSPDSARMLWARAFETLASLLEPGS